MPRVSVFVRSLGLLCLLAGLNLASVGLLAIVLRGGEALAGSADNYFPNGDEALTKAVTKAASPGADTTEGWVNTGLYDGTNWVRATPAMMGGSATTASNVNQETLSTTSEAIPATAMTSRTELCIFNQDPAINVFCKDTDAATTSNGGMIEPRTPRCFKATEVINCIAASGTPTIDYEER